MLEANRSSWFQRDEVGSGYIQSFSPVLGRLQPGCNRFSQPPWTKAFEPETTRRSNFLLHLAYSPYQRLQKYKVLLLLFLIRMEGRIRDFFRSFAWTSSRGEWFWWCQVVWVTQPWPTVCFVRPLSRRTISREFKFFIIMCQPCAPATQ